MSIVHAIYEGGVFRPLEPVDLPERCEVEIDVRPVGTSETDATLDEVYTILKKRFNSRERDVAARHNEHQP